MCRILKFILVLLSIFFTASLCAQTNKNVSDSQTYKEWKAERNQEYKSWKEKKQEEYEAFKRQETNWNAIVLGYEQEPAIVAEKDANIPDAELPIPTYVDESGSLKKELALLKAEIESLNKQLATQKLEAKPVVIKTSTPSVKVEIEAPKQKSKIDEVKVSPKQVEKVKVTPQKEEVIKESLYEKEKRAIPSSNPIQINYRLSSKFGYRKHPIHGVRKFHGGLDMACPTGTPINAPADGVIDFAGWVKGYGNFIRVKHKNGYVTAYGHLSSINVKRGQNITQKQIIGKVGTTGGSTGPHLHYEIVKNGKKVNPQGYL